VGRERDQDAKTSQSATTKKEAGAGRGKIKKNEMTKAPKESTSGVLRARRGEALGQIRGGNCVNVKDLLIRATRPFEPRLLCKNRAMVNPEKEERFFQGKTQ